MELNFDVLDCLHKAIEKSHNQKNWHIEYNNAGFYNRHRLQWLSVTNKFCEKKQHGWKLHISAHVYNAQLIFQAIIDSLLTFNTNFKLVGSLDFLIFLSNPNISKGQTGKFLTIYPETAEKAYAIAHSLHKITKHFSSPTIITDRPFCKNSIIYYRYGAHTAQYKQTLWGAFITTMEIDGRSIIDTKNPGDEIYQQLVNPFHSESILEVTPLEDKQENNNIIKYLQLSRNIRSEIFLCLDQKNNRRCIMKTAFADSTVDNLGNSAITRLQFEAKILQKLKPLQVAPQYYDSYDDKNNNYCLIMEDLPGRSLHDYLKTSFYNHKVISISKSLHISKQLAKHLTLIHTANIIHADIKLANIILIDDKEIKIIDFDSACDTENNIFISTSGSTGYTTAERDQGKIPTIYDDIYSFGACLYYLFTMIDPDTHPLELGQCEIDTSLFNKKIPDYIQPLIQACLSGAVNNFEEILSILQRKNKNLVSTTTRSSASYREKLNYLSQRIIEKSYNSGLQKFEFSNLLSDDLIIDDLRGASGSLLAFSMASIADINKESLNSVIKHCAKELCNNQLVCNAIPGLYAGESGKALALLYAAIATNDTELLIAAEQRMNDANNLPLQSFDLFNGVAGCLRVNLIFWRITNKPAYLNVAKNKIDYLIQHKYQDSKSFGWYNPTAQSTSDSFELNNNELQLGYSHGLAGIADVLLDYYLVTQDSEIEKLLKKIVNHLLQKSRSVLQKQGIAWPLNFTDSQMMLPYWCHGAAGISIFLSRMMRYNLWPLDIELLQKIITTIDTCTRAGPMILCHGTLGSLETFIDLQQHHPTLDNIEKITHFEIIVSNWLKVYTQNDLHTQNERYDHYGYLTGIVGTLSVYTRLIHPEIPNPLHFEYANYLKDKGYARFITGI